MAISLGIYTLDKPIFSLLYFFGGCYAILNPSSCHLHSLADGRPMPSDSILSIAFLGNTRAASQCANWFGNPPRNLGLPSGKLTVCYGKSSFLIGKRSISMGHLYHGYVSHNQRVSTTNNHNISDFQRGVRNDPDLIPFDGHLILWHWLPQWQITTTTSRHCVHVDFMRMFSATFCSFRYIHIWLICTCIYVYVCVCACVCAYVYIYIYTYIYIYMYIYIYIHIYIHIYIYVSYHIISYHIIQYHIISCHIHIYK